MACAVLGPRVVHAHQAPDRTLDAVRIEGIRPQIDGVLDDSVWQQAPIFTGFVQREPEEGQPASEKTTVQLAYDDEADWGAFRPGYNLRRSFVDEGTNIFLVKLNYWLNI